MSHVKSIHRAVFVFGLFVNLACMASTSPPSRLDTLSLLQREITHYRNYSHWQLIGVCTWIEWHPWPSLSMTPEIDEYEPDLVITVFNQTGDDPWDYANTLIDEAAHRGGSSMLSSVTGYELSEGNDSDITGTMHGQGLKRKVVDVIGNPLSLIPTLFPRLPSDTTAFFPYYQSEFDVVGNILGLGELLRPETYDPIHHTVGPSMADHWGYAFPRTMVVNNTNDFKAAVVMALHGADIVTNQHTLHTVKGTSDKCGDNCAVANVIEETHDDHEIWQEVYPHDRHIHLGETDVSPSSYVNSDALAGNGNYVFVLWRHYRGCLPGPGHLKRATVTVHTTVKR